MSKFMIPEAMRPWTLLLAMVFLILLLNIDYTAVNIALVVISKELETDLNTLQWLLSGYVLAWAAVVVPAGQLADIFGKRRMLTLGITLFALSSLWCGLSQDEWVLIAGRLAQGMSGALFVPPLYTLVFSAFPEDKQGLALGALGAGAGIGLAVGPTFGGVLLEVLSWRWIFLINVPLCLLTVLVTLICAEREPWRVSDHKFDLPGSILLGISLVLIMFGLNQMEVWGTLSSSVWGFIATGILILMFFLYSSRTKPNRLIPLGLFKNVPYLGCVLGFAIFEFIFSVVLVIVGLYLQNVAGYTAYESGIIFLSMTLAFGLLSPFGGKMTDKMDARIPACLGMALVAMGTTIAIFFSAQAELTRIMISLLFIGLGLGVALPAFNAAMMKTIDTKILSTASAVFIMFACLGNSLGVVSSTSLLVGLGEPTLKETLDKAMPTLTAIDLNNIYTVFGSAYRDLNLLQGLDIKGLIILMNEAFVQANSWIMLMTTFVGLTALFSSMKMIKIQKKKGDDDNSRKPVLH